MAESVCILTPIFAPVVSLAADTSFSETRYKLSAVLPVILDVPDNTTLSSLYTPPPLPELPVNLLLVNVPPFIVKIAFDCPLASS